MKEYELMMIIKPNMDSDEVDKVVAKVEETVKTMGGSIVETEKVGRKKLAYDVQNFRDGFFVVERLTIPTDKITEFKRQLKLNDNILRIMFLESSKVRV